MDNFQKVEKMRTKEYLVEIHQGSFAEVAGLPLLLKRPSWLRFQGD